ncbi:hypothetical protein K1X84_02260 [bacterium]|nr:hypothetical protein [bacterium]
MSLRFILVAMLILSCEDNSGFSESSSHSYRTLIRIGKFEGQNGSHVSGQFEVWRIDSTGIESFETLNDFTVVNISETIQFWLTDQTGFSQLSASSNKLMIDSLVSNTSGSHQFSIPEGHSVSLYTYAVLFGSTSQENLGGAKILLPPPPSDVGKF